MRKQKPQKFPILFLIVGGLLLVVSAVVLVMQNNTGQATQVSPVTGGDHEEETYPGIGRISLADAKAALDTGSAVFVDVRIVEAYTVNHIPGALNLPLGELETRLNELDPNQWIITYCT